MKALLPVVAAAVAVLLTACGESKAPPSVVKSVPASAVSTAPVTTQSSVVTTAPGAVTSAPSAIPPAHTPDAHNSKNSLTWAGTYKGIPVCDGCEKVEQELRLLDDNKFTLTYIDPTTKDQVKYEGDFKWDETGNSIGANLGGYNYVYRVGENGLIRQATDAPSDAKVVAPLEYKKAN